MTPKPIYETLPYACFFIGSLAWLSGNTIPVVVLGMVLYCLGAQLWVWRTSYRRPDRARAKLMGKSRSGNLRPHYRRWVWPFPLYEAMPFIYIAVGYGILMATRQAQVAARTGEGLLLLSALMLLFAGAMVLGLRGHHRLAGVRRTL